MSSTKCFKSTLKASSLQNTIFTCNRYFKTSCFTSSRMKEACSSMDYPLYSWIFLVLQKTPENDRNVPGRQDTCVHFPPSFCFPAPRQLSGLFILLPSSEALAGVSPASGYLSSSHGSPLYLARRQDYLQYKLSTWFLSEALFVEFVCGVGAEFAAPSGSV